MTVTTWFHVDGSSVEWRIEKAARLLMVAERIGFAQAKKKLAGMKDGDFLACSNVTFRPR